jgi:TIR domain
MYDIFVSYTSQDRPFALRIEQDLKRRSYNVFLDRTGLRAGEDWNEQLRDTIRDSRHLVVIWSDRHTPNSKWVTKEIAAFEERQAQVPTGKVIHVCLEGMDTTRPTLQAVTDIADAKAYLAPKTAQDALDTLDAEVWNRVLRQLDRVLELDRNWTTVSYVILAATRAEIAAMSPDEKPWFFGNRFEDMVHAFGLSLPALPARYGNARWDWRPLDGGREIEMLLDELRVEAFETSKLPKFRWKEIGEKLSSDVFAEAQTAAREILLMEQPCLVLIDPLSLYSKKIREIASRLLRGAIGNQCVASAVLPPFLASETRVLRRFLEVAAEEVHRMIYLYPEQSYANCNMMAADPFDLKRLIGPALAASKPLVKNKSLRMRPSQP